MNFHAVVGSLSFLVIFPVDMHVKLLLRRGPHLHQINYKYLAARYGNDRKRMKLRKQCPGSVTFWY
jgi:hypothetical protein